MSIKRFRRVVCIALSILMVMTNFVYADTAKADVAKCPDIVGNKYEIQLREWVDNGFIKGATDGNFKPNNTITRAEFMALVNRSFGFTEAAEINYSDVEKNNWFYKDAAIAAKVGYMKGSNGKLTPQDPISRQEFALVLARLTGNMAAADAKVISSLSDGKSIPEWSKAAVSATVGKGYFEGLIGTGFKPVEKISRLETVVALDRAFRGMYKAVYMQKGTFGPASGMHTLEGSAMIVSPEVTLKNTTVNGDLILRESIGDGNVYLDNVVVKGTTIVKGGGAHSIVIRNSTLGSVIVRREGNIVRIVATGSTTIGEVNMQSGATLHEEFLTGQGFGDVVIPDDILAGATIVFEGNFDDILVDSSNANINVGSGTIGNMTLAPEAAGTRVNLAQGARVSTLNLNAAVNITGQGTIQTANVNAQGSTIQQQPQNVVTAPGVTVVTNNSTPTPIPTPSTSGGGGGGGGSGGGGGNDEPVMVSSVTVVSAGNASTVIIGEKLQMGAAVAPENARNKAITWSITNGTGTATIDANGLLTATGIGTVTVKATNPASGVIGTMVIMINAKTMTVSDVEVINSTTVEVTMAEINGAVFTWNNAAVDAEYAAGAYTLTVPSITSTTNTLKISANDYNDKTQTVTITESVGNIKVISDADELDAAITGQQAGQVWIIKAGDYPVESKYRFDIDAVGDVGYNRYYFPIKADNLTIAGEGYPVIYGKTLTLNGVRATQNFITVMSDGVTIDGVIIMSKLAANKAIEVAGDKGGKNFTLRNSAVTKNTRVAYNNEDVDDYFGKVQKLSSDALAFPGSVYFYQNVGDSVVEDVMIEKGRISAGSITAGASVELRDVEIDYAGSVDAKRNSDYVPISTAARTLDVTADNVLVKVDAVAGHKLQSIIDNVPFGTRVELAAGEYYSTAGIAPIVPSEISFVAAGVTYGQADKIITSMTDLNAAIADQSDGKTWAVLPGTYNVPRDTVTKRNNSGVIAEDGQPGWYMPITADGLTIVGIGNPVITSSDVIPNGAWASQNLITVWGENVTFRGLTITPKVAVNKSVEVVGAKNFTIEECTFKPNTIVENAPADKGGSLYFNGAGTDGVGKDILVRNNTFYYATVAFDGVENSDITVSGNTFENIGSYAIGNTYWGSADRMTTQYADVHVNGNNFKNVSDATKIIAARLNQTFILDSENKIDGSAINADEFEGYINFNNLAYWIACKNNKVIVDGETYLSPYQDVDYYAANEAQLISAISAAADGNEILVEAGTYNLTAQLNITKAVSITGRGEVTLKAVNDSWSTVNGYKHLLAIYAGTEAAPVTISNITIDADGKSHAVNTYYNAYGVLNDVTIKNGKGAGLTVNGSTIIATNLNTSGNDWGAVNVDPGVDVETPSVFELLGEGTLEEGTQIWSDGRNVSERAPVEVRAEEYTMYPVGGELPGFVWASRELANVAKITKNVDGTEITTVYTTIQAAIDDAEINDVIDVTAGTYKENVVVNKKVTINGAGVEETILIATDGNKTPLTFAANDATVSGFTITHEYTPEELLAWNFNNNGVIFLQLTSGNTLSDCVVELNRNGIYLNNCQGNKIINNTISNNRTGINMTNKVNDTEITGNTISDNWTIGLVFYCLTAEPGLLADLSTVTVGNNTFSNNWYTEILIKDAPSCTGDLVVSGNTFTDNPVTYTTSSDSELNEPGFAAQKPAVEGIGGTETRPVVDLPTLRIYNSGTIQLVYDHQRTLNVGAYEPYKTLETAVNDAQAGDVIMVGAGIYELNAQLNITKAITIIGEGEVILKAASDSWSTENGHKHLLAIYAGTEAAPVNITNITIDADGKSHAVNTYYNAYGVLNDVTIKNGKGAGLTVNGSTIVATNLNTSGNEWGAVNVDPGVDVETPSVFVLQGEGTLEENTQIWSDGVYVGVSATVTVNADGYTRTVIVGNACIWTNRTVLAEGSLGIASYEEITGLEAGMKYVVTADGITLGVLADGTLGLESSEPEELIGTSITGLVNGKIYMVEFAAVASDSFEPDDTMENAVTIAVDDVAQTHTISPEGDEDWVKFTAIEGRLYGIKTSNLIALGDMDTVVELYAADGTPIDYDDDGRDYYEEYASLLEWTADQDGTYYIRIVHYNNWDDDIWDSAMLRAASSKSKSAAMLALPMLPYTGQYDISVSETIPYPTDVSVEDNDTNAGVDGRDISVSWTPSGVDDVIAQYIYIIPAEAALVNPELLECPYDFDYTEVFDDNITSDWTGDEGSQDILDDPISNIDYYVMVMAEYNESWAWTWVEFTPTNDGEMGLDSMQSMSEEESESTIGSMGTGSASKQK